MEPKQIGMIVVAALLIVVAVVLVVRQMGPTPEEQDPLARFVCDNCGFEEKAPHQSMSRDCPKCDKGQMVQRVYFRPKAGGEVFEAYQQCWSPAAERAAAKREEANSVEPLSGGIRLEEACLVRRPGGKWVWLDTTAGRTIYRGIIDPKTGKPGRYEDFEKVLNPTQK